jgi:hypothetical protein
VSATTIIRVLDFETGEIVELEIDVDALRAMGEAEERQQRLYEAACGAAVRTRGRMTHGDEALLSMRSRQAATRRFAHTPAQPIGARTRALSATTPGDAESTPKASNPRAWSRSSASATSLASGIRTS